MNVYWIFLTQNLEQKINEYKCNKKIKNFFEECDVTNYKHMMKQIIIFV